MRLREYTPKIIVACSLLATLVAIVLSWFIYEDRNKVALAKNVYWEALAANEPELSARMVAHVTALRAKANRSYWGGAEIHNVVYKRTTKGNGITVCQFTWTCQAAANKEPGGKEKWELALRIAKDEIAGKFIPPTWLANATFYLNPKYSGRPNICWFKTKLVLLGKADEGSQHIFYREPRGVSEKAALPKRASVEECKPPKSPKKKGATSAARSFRAAFLFLYG